MASLQGSEAGAQTQNEDIQLKEPEYIWVQAAFESTLETFTHDLSLKQAPLLLKTDFGFGLLMTAASLIFQVISDALFVQLLFVYGPSPN